MAKKPLPRELEEDLAKVRHFRAGSGDQRSASESLSKMFDDGKERAMFDEVFGSVRRPSLSDGLLPRIQPSGAPSSGLLAPKGSSGTDFTSTLLQRLRIVEEEAAESRTKLAEQVMKNEKLEKQVALLKSLAKDPQEAMQKLDGLRAENRRLQQQIDEMEEFLADYGLVWVGKYGSNLVQQEGEDGDEEEGGDEDAVETGRVDFHQFRRAVQELNEIIYSEPAKVVLSGKEQSNAGRRGRIVQASEAVDKVKVVFYRNGLMIQRGPFRPVRSPGYESFTKDILDGYFPSEFSKDYPDGFIIDLVDQHLAAYDEKSSAPLSSHQLVQRLPATKISKDGTVVDIRSDIAKRLQSDGNSGVKLATVIETQASRHLKNQSDGGMKGEGAGEEEQSGSSLGSVATIQIKWMDGTSFLAKAFALNTISELKGDILRHVASQGAAVSEDRKRLELRCVHPMRVLLDGMTVMEANLVPNGTVHARLI